MSSQERFSIEHEPMRLDRTAKNYALGRVLAGREPSKRQVTAQLHHPAKELTAESADREASGLRAAWQ